MPEVGGCRSSRSTTSGHSAGTDSPAVDRSSPAGRSGQAAGNSSRIAQDQAADVGPQPEQNSPPAAPRVIDILQRYAPEVGIRYRFARHVVSVLAKILLCRTPTLKERRYQCPQCGHESVVFNSCTDRNCPQCSGARRRSWLDAATRLILPGVNYFQVIFTLPEQLSPLILGNRKELYSLLFQSAWCALNHCLRQTGKYHPAAMMVLHTWNQRLGHHPHIHAIVPGVGPALEGKQWITAQHPTDPNYRKPYLVDNVELGRAFRKRYLLGLRRLIRLGKLKLDGEWSRLNEPVELQRWCAELKQTDWNVFIEGPPNGQSKPKHVLSYLTRYLAGGPIHDGRIISDDDGWIRFWARSKDKNGGNQQQPTRLHAFEFVRCWLMHVLPKGFMRSRRYGGFHTTQSEAYLERCRKLLPSPDTDSKSTQPENTTVTDSNQTKQADNQPQCPHCQVPMECTFKARRPSWKQVFDVEVYRSPDIYCPLLHVLRLEPP